jgi:hypothetical protein
MGRGRKYISLRLILPIFIINAKSGMEETYRLIETPVKLKQQMRGYKGKFFNNEYSASCFFKV